jgi:hypothetical protein
LKAIAAEGVITCLQDAIESLEQGNVRNATPLFGYAGLFSCLFLLLRNTNK